MPFFGELAEGAGRGPEPMSAMGLVRKTGRLPPLGVMPRGGNSAYLGGMALPSERAETFGYLTSGDISRLLGVDLKTVHNWANQGGLRGYRTSGGHRRFHRAELVRFLRRFGLPPCGPLMDPPARVVVATRATDGALRARGSRPVEWETCPTIFDAALIVGSGEFDAVAVDLGSASEQTSVEFVTALRRRECTRGIGIIGIGGSASSRRGFLKKGGDIAVMRPAELRLAVCWLLDASARPRISSELLVQFDL
jgi:excisionase family DNA binding protein